MNDIFNLRENHYNLRRLREFECNNVRIVKFGVNTNSSKGPQHWQSLLYDIKNSGILHIFKGIIRFWKNRICPCRVSSEYIQGWGFI